jgi:predicted dinucleotide-binding enzyme
MRIAISGPGGMGGGIGRLARAGHEVVFSGSRSPEKLPRAAELAGPTACTATVPDAAAKAYVGVVAVPFDRYSDVPASQARR